MGSHIQTEEYSPRESVRFLHAVGKSTVLQGITIPAAAQDKCLRALAKGQAEPVTIRYGEGHIAEAVLRRINNAVGHLQFRYEGKKNAPLRDYLRTTFGNHPANALLEVAKVGPSTYEFRPIAPCDGNKPQLTLYEPFLFGISEHDPDATSRLSDVNQVLRQVEYDPMFAQAEYNSRISQAFLTNGWREEVRILDQIGLRVDFEKDNLWVEVEFGNARTYYQDYMNLLLAGRYRAAKYGMLLSPTTAFANMLCELGQTRAAAKRGTTGKIPSYSGMMTFEKALREFPYLSFIITHPLIIGGLHFATGLKRQSEARLVS